MEKNQSNHLCVNADVSGAGLFWYQTGALMIWNTALLNVLYLFVFLLYNRAVPVLYFTGASTSQQEAGDGFGLVWFSLVESFLSHHKTCTIEMIMSFDVRFLSSLLLACQDRFVDVRNVLYNFPFHSTIIYIIFFSFHFHSFVDYSYDRHTQYWYCSLRLLVCFNISHDGHRIRADPFQFCGFKVKHVCESLKSAGGNRVKSSGRLLNNDRRASQLERIWTRSMITRDSEKDETRPRMKYDKEKNCMTWYLRALADMKRTSTVDVKVQQRRETRTWCKDYPL